LSNENGTKPTHGPITQAYLNEQRAQRSNNDLADLIRDSIFELAVRPAQAMYDAERLKPHLGMGHLMGATMVSKVSGMRQEYVEVVCPCRQLLVFKRCSHGPCETPVFGDRTECAEHRG
jgi:hypothetical protein